MHVLQIDVLQSNWNTHLLILCYVGSWAQIIQLGFGLWSRAWGFGREREKSESEDEYLLGKAKHRSSIDLNVQSDLPRSSSNRDVHHKHTRKMRTQKYLRESCYHSIECSVANCLAALMRKWPLNSTFPTL